MEAERAAAAARVAARVAARAADEATRAEFEVALLKALHGDLPPGNIAAWRIIAHGLMVAARRRWPDQRANGETTQVTCRLREGLEVDLDVTLPERPAVVAAARWTVAAYEAAAAREAAAAAAAAREEAAAAAAAAARASTSAVAA